MPLAGQLSLFETTRMEAGTTIKPTPHATKMAAAGRDLAHVGGIDAELMTSYRTDQKAGAFRRPKADAIAAELLGVEPPPAKPRRRCRRCQDPNCPGPLPGNRCHDEHRSAHEERRAASNMMRAAKEIRRRAEGRSGLR